MTRHHSLSHTPISVVTDQPNFGRGHDFPGTSDFSLQLLKIINQDESSPDGLDG